MTYQTAYNKIIDAYFKDEIKPYYNEFCFCGTLSPDRMWRFEFMKDEKHDVVYPYTVLQYTRMESALLFGIMHNMGLVGDPFDPVSEDGEHFTDEEITRSEGFEDALFSGMSAALDVLKQIHIERGEAIDETPAFTKRQPV